MKKRHLAAPFIMTALLSPAFADSTPPIHKNPPPRTKKLPKAPDGAKVGRSDDGTCWYQAPASPCPPGEMCNPPPPYEVECPPKK